MQDKELNQEKFPTLTSSVAEIPETNHQLNEWNKITADSENDLSQLKAIEEDFRAVSASLKKQLAKRNSQRELLLDELEHEVTKRKRLEEELQAIKILLEKQLVNSDSERELLSEELEREITKRKHIEKEFRKKIPRYRASLVAASIIIIIAVATGIISQQHHFASKVDFKPLEIVAPAVQATVNTSVNLQEQPSQRPQITHAEKHFVAETSRQAQASPALPQPEMPGKQNAVQLISSPQQNVPVVEKKDPVVINKGPDILVIRAIEETWLRIKIDHNPPFQVLLKPGEKIERKGAGFELDIGNAGGITIQFKGKFIENVGNSGQVIHMKLQV
jgi:hypothetical protein